MAYKQFQDIRCQKIVTQRLKAKYGILRRAYGYPATKQDIATAGTVTEVFVTLPKKGWVKRMGFQSAASDVVLATSDGFDLINRNGTVLGTFRSGSDYTLGTGAGTARDLETGTFVGTNAPLRFRIPATNVGIKGSVYFFIEYEPSDRNV